MEKSKFEIKQYVKTIDGIKGTIIDKAFLYHLDDYQYAIQVSKDKIIYKFQKDLTRID